MHDLFTWLLIALCLTQSAMFSGLNLALFSLSKLQLETEVKKGSQWAVKIARLRGDANLLLCTILWGNVSVNVLLTILADSVMAGVGGFLFSTVGITFFGEIMPQAYFSRHALRMGARLSPLIRVYRIVLFPVAKPSAILLDRWIGPEGTRFFKEDEFEVILDQHIREPSSDISYAEGRGALNFLRLDDLRVSGEGSQLAPETIIDLPLREGKAFMPEPDSEEEKALLKKIVATDHKWVVLLDETGRPCYALNVDDCLRDLYCGRREGSLLEHCQKPIVTSDSELSLDRILPQLDVEPEAHHDRVLDREVVLYWGERRKRIITGPDLLGRLLHGIVIRRKGA
ncbi:DUF21 domain-containing protein [Roseibacillus ishigakijimensis]|uniref:DUF21 domain-containing protein n=1 Tax=Roseibacillus ishigakijimensis TaxID=454146 RepID=A0A934RQ80_9BACT|nr:DUF21 domain-containing protein [Roseibacillus ishigakijimensis]MBK1834938.1 DUF21 domain-containing protein [Roseibacillus ishigakijimensis]